ncbi:mannose-6-phosphate isomerase, class I [Gracilinema caldarium]|uniref:mannose-6-phosphate isomerase n=1 Tax=Gracilinema caldarium (strain ATCC 51460 / DSM 7334 / H1) TaxID=744872 RepID=F8F1Z8_GRAC1|nr:mannose-6-phosphate isomerase, class I [Gracilinema caldarium]AEJ19845.1 mannose-6-phosphate isomerase, class I [Gracilinema caldarium DSM 7334]
MNNKKKPNFYLLKNPIQRYAWGSKHWIQDLLDLSEQDRQGPMAELWMGAHSRSPSIAFTDETEQPLDKLIQEHPVHFLGDTIAHDFSSLPYLFKILAAASPLSIQAHPDKQQAEQGFAREAKAGIPLSAENRNYKDSNHKPEIICAISPFTAMCGFRTQAEIAELLSLLDVTELEQSLVAIQQIDRKEAYRDFLLSLFLLPQQTRERITKHIQAKLPKLEQKHPRYAKEWELINLFCTLYPGDSAIISPLYLNVLSLNPGEAIFLPAGVLHAYIHGFGVELMANSDNVLRGGLTPKHIDIKELLNIIRFESFKPAVLSAQKTQQGYHIYPSQVREFSLFHVAVTMDKAQQLMPGTPIILIVLDGCVSIGTEQEKKTLQKGMSVFLPAEREQLILEGSAHIFGATTGEGTR